MRAPLDTVHDIYTYACIHIYIYVRMLVRLVVCRLYIRVAYCVRRVKHNHSDTGLT